jgi:hypothetical protein
VTVTRNARGKVTLAFPQGLQGLEKAEVLTAVEQILKEMGLYRRQFRLQQSIAEECRHGLPTPFNFKAAHRC